MAIIIKIKTEKPDDFLKEIINAIETNEIETWTYKNGYFSHSPEQWLHKAWFKPEIDLENNKLKFGIYPPNNGKISKSIYGIYHGRFIEMILNHFDEKISKITATALIEKPDYIENNK